MFHFFQSKTKLIIYLIVFIFSNYCILVPHNSFANNEVIEVQKVYQLLQEKKFIESIDKLKKLSLNNNIQAQLLYSKILFSGDLVPQDFEKSYLWATSAFLGGLKKSSAIIEKLDNYLTEEQTNPIKETLKKFLEKRAFINDKRAMIQIAKFYENHLNPPDIVNAYTWYNIAVAKGIKSAKKRRNEVLKVLKEKDLLEAQKLSNKLFKQIKN